MVTLTHSQTHYRKTFRPCSMCYFQCQGFEESDSGALLFREAALPILPYLYEMYSSE